MDAGWFPAPDDLALLRYWDGTAWTAHTSPAPTPTPAPTQTPPPAPIAPAGALPTPPQYAPTRGGQPFPTQPQYAPTMGRQPFAGQPVPGQPLGGQPFPVQPYGGQPYSGQPTPAKKSKALWLVPLLVVVIAGAGVGGWFAWKAMSGPATLDDVASTFESHDVSCRPGEDQTRSDFIDMNTNDELAEEDQLWAKTAIRAVEDEPTAKTLRLYYCWEDGVDTDDADELAHGYADVLTIVESGQSDRPILVSISDENDFEDEVKDLDVKVLIDPAEVDWVTDGLRESLGDAYRPGD